MAHFSAKDARTLMARTGVRAVGEYKCVVCGGPLPEGRTVCCCDGCAYKRSLKSRTKGKARDPLKYKINKCRYCGLRADSSDNKRTYTDSAQVKWFRCGCTPTEAQLFNVADMEQTKEDYDE